MLENKYREGLPPHLSVNASGDQYYYRDPKTRRTIGLEHNREAAISFAVEKNLACGIIKKGDLPKRFVKSALFVESPDLMTEEEIRAAAQPIKQLCGVYLLLDAGRVVYVGQSTNCHTRIGTHFYERGKVFDAYHLIECKPKDLKKLETQYIGKFMPKYNVLMPKALGSLEAIAA